MYNTCGSGGGQCTCLLWSLLGVTLYKNAKHCRRFGGSLFPSESNCTFFPVSIRLQMKGVSGPYMGCFISVSWHVSSQSSLLHDHWFLLVRLCGTYRGHLGACPHRSVLHCHQFLLVDHRPSRGHSFLISVTLLPLSSLFCPEY
jgi:hypothetical protein